MGFLHTTCLLFFAINNIHARVLPRNSNGTVDTPPDSDCTTSYGPSCESAFDRIPNFVKAIIFIGAFMALGLVSLAVQRFVTCTKGFLPSWMRSRPRPRPNVLPSSQVELVMCWERFGPKDETGRPRAGTQKELLRLWRSKGQSLRFGLVAEPPEFGEGAPFIVQGTRTIHPSEQIRYDAGVTGDAS